MAMSYLSSSEPASLLPLIDLPEMPPASFFKDQCLDVIRVVLLAGKRMPMHKVEVPATVRCLEGQVDLNVGSAHKIMHGGDLLYLTAGMSHELVAVENSSLLVTTMLLEPSAQPG